MAGSALSRRFSEFVGVALFALALLWLISLGSYSASDPVWFFNTGSDVAPANFAGRIGAFMAELSYQLLGYSAYLLPPVLVVLGWHYFWCRSLDAAYTKLIGAGLLFGCASSFLSLASASQDGPRKSFRAGGYLGDALASLLSAYLNRTGSIILILTLLFLAIILSTQFSFGRLFAAIGGLLHDRWTALVASHRESRENRRRDKQRQEVIKKHLDKQPKDGRPDRPKIATREGFAEGSTSVAEAGGRAAAKVPPPGEVAKKPSRTAAVVGAAAAALKAASSRPTPTPATIKRPIPPAAPSLPLSEPEKLPAERKKGAYTLPPLALLDAPRSERKIDERELISMRELLEADSYKRSASKLTLALGKTIHGEPFVSDLATMPHLLIAGSTGTGKSVSVNAMLSSILFRATPDDVRLIMIDPKRLELGMYEEIPHLLTPVVVDPKLAANALRWAVREMEERYKTLAAVGVRNIEQYNRNLKLAQAENPGPVLDSKGNEVRPLPCIVVLIDELADLMMVASNEVEESICRLAQMARAVGIHLILATQRPSVDVITGLIKANLPARISFRVSSKIDSRTILDGNGAEQLLGKGDMLYLPPASSRFVRLHGPYISEQESARLASFLRKQGKPSYDTTITDDDKKAGGDLDFEKDDLYDEAARIVVSSGQASVSYLQRRLRIGFSRAARLVDMMEAEGLVSGISGAAGGKSREVLVKPDYFDEVDAQLR